MHRVIMVPTTVITMAENQLSMRESINPIRRVLQSTEKPHQRL